MGFVEAVQVYDGGVDVPQVDDFGLLVPVLVKDGVGTDEEENTDPHDERTKDLQPIRVQIPAERFDSQSETVQRATRTTVKEETSGPKEQNHLEPEPL